MKLLTYCDNIMYIELFQLTKIKLLKVHLFLISCSNVIFYLLKHSYEYIFSLTKIK